MVRMDCQVSWVSAGRAVRRLLQYFKWDDGGLDQDASSRVLRSGRIVGFILRVEAGFPEISYIWGTSVKDLWKHICSESL